MNTKNNQKGFTLIELMVVISIIGLLSTIVTAGVAQARISARDTVRQENTRQIDLAINLYINDKGHAPLLQDTCGSLYFTAQTYSIGCIAVQNKPVNTPAYNAWIKLQADLADYIKKLPTDPCGNCSGQGYTYVAPSAIYYDCANIVNCDKDAVSDSSYQIYTLLERSSKVVGKSTFGSYVIPTGNPY